jgi:excisionase family DNA binding protein
MTRTTRRPGVYTNGEAARLYGVSTRSVAKWCDEGGLVGYRIPGGRDRRYQAEEIRRFGLRHDMLRVVETGAAVGGSDMPRRAPRPVGSSWAGWPT